MRTGTPTTMLQVPLPPGSPAGVYVHIPFCTHICPYCDFNTYSGQEALIPAYVAALLREMEITAERFDPPGSSPTLFLGGGTPSLLDPSHIESIIQASTDVYGLEDNAEVTCEVNPESVDAGYLAALRSAGVNRLSIGIQSQQRAGLRVLGRGHKAIEAGSAFRAARGAGFDNISLDFIFGWPGQTAEEWDADLSTILEWEPEHVSLYSLIVEPSTPMAAAVQRGILTVIDDDTVADFYDRATERLGGAGWEHYEIANWARTPAHRSRHNQLYWQNGHYFGFGAGAHSHLGNLRGSNLRLPGAYIDAVTAGRRPLAMAETIDSATEMGESMMLGLRLLVEGVSSADFAARHGEDMTAIYAHQIERFTSIGMLEWSGERLRLTASGMLLANDICAEFLP
jgi:oxygen-independent coproporphyrinogen III oxidase